MRMASVIVTYHPIIEEVIDNLASYADDVDLLLLWDNSENHLDLSPLRQAYPNIIIHQDNMNEGLPAAYNWAIGQAKENGCTLLMTMDQDSSFEHFPAYRAWLEKRTTPCISGVPINENNRSDEEETEIGTVCQSGGVFLIDMFEQIGGFRDDLFIGMVDAEISLRALAHGYRIVQFNGSNLRHKVGSGRTVRFFGRSSVVSDYNALRHFYDSRNRILLWHEFPGDFSFRGKMRHLLGRMKVIIKILFFETDKWVKISAIVKGTYCGIRNRAVPYQKPQKKIGGN